MGSKTNEFVSIRCTFETLRHNYIVQYLKTMFRQRFLLHDRVMISSVTSHLLQQRSISSRREALKVLDLADKKFVTTKDLRVAYFQAAKKCHPDTNHNLDTIIAGQKFHRVTEAYERLIDDTYDEEPVSISQKEETRYRDACMYSLGVSAEMIENAKQSPMFLCWLGGNTGSAQRWRTFIAQHGGLGKKVNTTAGLLNVGNKKLVRRRRMY